MSRLFFVPASTGLAIDHFESSLAHGIDLSTAESLGEVYPEIQRHAENGRFFAWGSRPGARNPTTWENLAIGDVALIYRQGMFTHCARVYAKAHSKAVAEAIWGTADGETWEYMFFLDHPVPVDIGLDQVIEAFGYGSDWIPRGSMIPGPAARDQMLTAYGSVAGFLEAMTEGSADLGPAVDGPEADEALETIESAVRGSQGKGQGWRRSARVRKAIEDRAMTLACEHLIAMGWEVEDVSARESYDLRCTQPDAPELHVEVKGTSSLGATVFLTKNEVRHAKDRFPHVALCVVSGIDVSGSADAPMCSGGELKLTLPWDLHLGHLTALAYSYAVPLAPGS